MEHSVQDPRQATEFVQLLTSHQRRLYVYIMTFLPHLADADEVLQETNVVLWSKSHEFISGTSFSDWAYKIAYFQVLAFRKRGVRNRLVFAHDMLETFSSEIDAIDPGQRDRLDALAGCLQKLPDRDRDLIGRRYSSGATVDQMAIETSRPASSIYRSLERIRDALLTCIQRATVNRETDS